MSDPKVTAPAFDVKDARTILATFDELENYAGLDGKQAELRRKCKLLIAYWAVAPIITHLNAAAELAPQAQGELN